MSLAHIADETEVDSSCPARQSQDGPLLRHARHAHLVPGEDPRVHAHTVSSVVDDAERRLRLLDGP
eukprot:6518278-Heterocapsa_arctica.AAC.1